MIIIYVCFCFRKIYPIHHDPCNNNDYGITIIMIMTSVLVILAIISYEEEMFFLITNCYLMYGMLVLHVLYETINTYG